MSCKSSKWFALSRKTDDRHPGNPSRPRPVPREAAWLLAPRGRPSPAPARRGNSDRKPREVQTTRSRGCGARRPQPFGVQDLERGGKADKKTNRGAHVFQKANATPGRSFSRPLRARGVRRPRDVAAGVACGGASSRGLRSPRARARRAPPPPAGAGAGARSRRSRSRSQGWRAPRLLGRVAAPRPQLQQGLERTRRDLLQRRSEASEHTRGSANASETSAEKLFFTADTKEVPRSYTLTNHMYFAIETIPES